VAIVVVGGAVAAFCLYRQVDNEIRLRTETRLAEHYKGLVVKIRAAQLVEGKGIRVFDLVISDPNLNGPCAELFRVEEAMFECPTDWKELINGDPPVQRVTIRRPTLRATRQVDGTWSTAKLLPLPHFSHRPPEVAVENGVIVAVGEVKNHYFVNYVQGGTTRSISGMAVRFEGFENESQQILHDCLNRFRVLN